MLWTLWYLLNSLEVGLGTKVIEVLFTFSLHTSRQNLSHMCMYVFTSAWHGSHLLGILDYMHS